MLLHIPVNQKDSLQDLLKGYGIRLSDKRRMSDVIPLKISSEQEQVEEEINGSNQSDNMTHLGEVLVIVLWFTNSD